MMTNDDDFDDDFDDVKMIMLSMTMDDDDGNFQ